MHADVRAVVSTLTGMALVIGAVDGSVVTLAVADPQLEKNSDFINKLPTRHSDSMPFSASTSVPEETESDNSLRCSASF